MSGIHQQQASYALSAAHRTLCIAEIASNVASELRLMSYPDQKPSLLALALTCKTLYDPAMNELWYQARSLNRLLACLPGHLWQKTINPLGTPVCMVELVQSSNDPQDWERFEHYARRVRNLLLCPENVGEAAFREFCTRYDSQNGATSPFINLSFLLYEGHPQEMRACSFLIGPWMSGSSVSLDIYSDVTEEDEEFYQRLSHVQSLEIESRWGMPIPGISHIPDFCFSMSHNNLQSLEIAPMISARSVYDISTFPQLHTLLLNDVREDGFHYPQADPNTPSFRCLQRLRVFNGFHPVQSPVPGAFIRSVQGPLREVNLGSDWLGIVNTTFNDVLDALRSHTELMQLSIYCRAVAEDAVVHVNSGVLSPLCRCTKLRSLALSQVDVQIKPEDIKRLGTAWPALQYLKIVPASISAFRERPTLRLCDLREFAIHFPRLFWLSIPFDAADGWPSQYLPLSPVRSATLTHLGVRPECLIEGSVSALSSVAMLLMEVFPSVTISLDLIRPPGIEEDEEVIGWVHRWNAVSKLMSKFKLAKERATCGITEGPCA